jgi:hypothetical protein
MTDSKREHEKRDECPYCRKPIEVGVTRRIIDRAWNDVAQKQYVRTRSMIFCSETCGRHYQMGCEG